MDLAAIAAGTGFVFVLVFGGGGYSTKSHVSDEPLGLYGVLDGLPLLLLLLLLLLLPLGASPERLRPASSDSITTKQQKMLLWKQK
ncbi:unnamed protein product [Heligmosomoides polygyrus]|uniref:Uncharacterized protein n=1 Tax=Heligmosomoides polygyrus TaxID=6339 RepID=A0A183GID4_HELPZ|nr:unnamed protein product [Heligmosomoides polygyrus]